MKLQVYSAILGLGLSGLALADQFHYQNVLMGDRAMGLGGAFCAVSDDASGVVYNPAGLAFALSNDISGSGNAYYTKEIKYKKTIGTKPFVEKSGGTLAPFFGALQKLDKTSPGLVAAFGLYNQDSELKDQDDNIENQGSILRFHRAVTQREATSGIAFAAAKRFGIMGLGASLTYFSADELVQEYQDVKQGSNSWVLAGGDPQTPFFRILTQNVRQQLKVNALALGLGAQWALNGGLSLGLSVKIPTIITQSFENGSEQNTAYVYNQDGKYVLVNKSDLTVGHELADTVGQLGRTEISHQTESNPMGQWPTEIRAGVAWFASAQLMWTMDVIHYTATSGALAKYKRDAVTNFASGLEYYATPSIPIRLGLFTNSDARPQPLKSKMNQRDQIDYKGGTLFIGWVQPNSQIALGSIAQKGTGKAQKIANSVVIQDVEAMAITYALAATHSF